jgi:hypothetical protein
MMAYEEDGGGPVIAVGQLGVAAAAIVLILTAAMLFKVWNERKMTLAYERQAEAQERIADAAERAHPIPIEKFTKCSMSSLVPRERDLCGETAVPVE